MHMAIPSGRLELVFSFEFVVHCQVAPLHRLVSRLRTVGHDIVDGQHVRVVSKRKCAGDGSCSLIRHLSEGVWKKVALVEAL